MAISKTTKGKGRHYLSTKEGAGMTSAGRKAYNAATGSKLKAPQPEGGSRRDSFCARMSGAAKKATKNNERAVASLRRWNCSNIPKVKKG